MTDRHYYWRLLSESFDRKLTKEEQELLEFFMAEHAPTREFEGLFKRIRDGSTVDESLTEIDSSLNQHLSDTKKNEIQCLLESALKKQQDSLSNRDVVFACELVNQGAISLGDLTGKISQWNSDSKSLSGFLKSASTVADVDFSKIESHVSETIFSQTLDQTLLDEVVSAIKQQVREDDFTVLESAADDFGSCEFIKLIDKTNSGVSGAFESLLERLINESRTVISQARIFSQTLRLKPAVEEITLRLIGRKKLNQAQLGCYYRNLGNAIRKIFESDPELGNCLLRSIGNWQVAVTQIIDALNHLADEEPGFVRMFNLGFFTGLTVQQVGNLLDLTEQEVSAECGYGTARLLQLIHE